MSPASSGVESDGHVTLSIPDLDLMAFLGNLKPQKFEIRIPEQDLLDLKTLVGLGRLPPRTYEGADAQYGVTNDWMSKAKDYWLNDFDWLVESANHNMKY